jgi:hypothetical protein
MKYLFLLYNDEDEWENMEDAKKNDIFGAYMAYTDALRNSGVHISGAPLTHSRDGKRIRADGVQDGPFADGKEQLGGFYMVEVKDLDEALKWAARCPCASMGHVEVRPIWDIGE